MDRRGGRGAAAVIWSLHLHKIIEVMRVKNCLRVTPVMAKITSKPNFGNFAGLFFLYHSGSPLIANVHSDRPLVFIMQRFIVVCLWLWSCSQRSAAFINAQRSSAYCNRSGRPLVFIMLQSIFSMFVFVVVLAAVGRFYKSASVLDLHLSQRSSAHGTIFFVNATATMPQNQLVPYVAHMHFRTVV